MRAKVEVECLGSTLRQRFVPRRSYFAHQQCHSLSLASTSEFISCRSISKLLSTITSRKNLTDIPCSHFLHSSKPLIFKTFALTNIFTLVFVGSSTSSRWTHEPIFHMHDTSLREIPLQAEAWQYSTENMKRSGRIIANPQGPKHGRKLRVSMTVLKHTHWAGPDEP